MTSNYQNIFEKDSLQGKRLLPVLRMMKLFYFVIGGIYLTKGASKLTKIVWTYFLFTFISVGFSGSVGYLLTTKLKVTAPTVLLLLWSFSGTIYVVIVLPLITYRCNNNFQILFAYIQENSKEEPPGNTQETNDHKKINSVAEGLFWITMEWCSLMSFILSCVIDVAFLCDNEYAFRDLQHHIVALPYLESLPSLNIAFWFYLLEIGGFMTVGCAATFSQTGISMMIATELHNIAIDLCKSIDNLTEMSNTFNWGCEVSEKELRVFEERFVLLVTQYQELIKVTNLIRPFVEIMNTLFLSVFVIGVLGTIYPILTDNLETALKIKYVLLTFSYCVIFYAHCELGNKFNMINDMIPQQVYNMPWYHLPAKRRKLYYIFLCQVQCSIEFKAFRVYPVNLESFPRVLKAVYSYVNVLHQVVN